MDFQGVQLQRHFERGRFILSLFLPSFRLSNHLVSHLHSASVCCWSHLFLTRYCPSPYARLLSRSLFFFPSFLALSDTYSTHAMCPRPHSCSISACIFTPLCTSLSVYNNHTLHFPFLPPNACVLSLFASRLSLSLFSQHKRYRCTPTRVPND